MNTFYRFCKGIVYPLAKLIYPFRIINGNTIPKTGRYIICSNHISMLDPVFLGCSQKRQLHFIAKAELFKNRLFAKIIRKLGAFPVHRGAGDNTAMDNALSVLKEGHVLGIFPEGTRSKDGNLLRPKPGIIMFAYQGNAPILPVAIVAKKGQVKPFHRTLINCGEPIQPEELGITSGSGMEMRNASRLVMSRIAARREEVRDGHFNKKP